MPSTYSTKYRLELPAFGEKVNLWGPIVNSNLGTLLEQAIDGYLSIAMSDANLTLTTVDAANDQARNKMLRFTGTLTATREVIIPTTSRSYMMWNGTTQSLTYKTVGGAGVTFPSGARAWVFCDGVDTYELGNYARITGGSISGIASISATDVLRGANNLADLAQNNITGNYTLVDTDRHRSIYRTGASACALTVPANSTTAFPLGTFILVAVDNSASDMTVTPAGGVTLRQAGSAVSGTITLSARAAVWLVKVGTNEWFLIPTPANASAGALFAANNLSDVANAATSRANLGLGTAAVTNTGTSGATVPLLNGSNTHTDARGLAAAATSDLQLGFRRLRAASVTSGAPVAADSDSCIYATGGVTIPSSTFQQGDCLLIYNATDSNLTLTQGSGMFMRREGTTSSGNRTLLPRSRASILFLSSGECVIGGAIT
jgi:hypothetical protein